MKQVFISVVAGWLLISLITLQAQAVTPTIAPPVCAPTLTIPAPGVSCGYANDPCNSRCCANNPKTQQTPLPGLITDMLTLLHLPNPVESLLSFQTAVATQPCMDGIPSTPGDLSNPSCHCIDPPKAPLDTLIKLCDNISSSDELNKCKSCLQGTGQSVGVWTGVGCVRSNAASFIQETLLGWGVGLAGGISMLCIIYAAIMMQTSGGNAEKVKKAQQLMTSCITGLMIIIFSVLILQLIGVKILRIPGFQ
ncbi:hypothetical protein COY90_00430 [Candidatus Roizmanbacteria bacterium CG_4_10_14_0_8_um_filter_39_9]|uniref:Uncharacterized protein n=1 Tax=Candidatus Roizmanbacteria bacterium CG_4_10_14_0_8_um_filter_39_9 TaxID=1974829 RepID=A0A2M7QE25_9BACT|nr:MAG: hypothetical protein COY90_00430 [Candidatus Roizmanbacteria bacterium CG_4_10_14_0_8_um_filter_39_9]